MHTEHPACCKDHAAEEKKRASWKRETLVALALFSAALVGVITVRGFTKKTVETASSSQAVVTGNPAGSDEAVDNGAGGVIVSAQFNRKESIAGNPVFTLALNTHTVDLSAFDPQRNVQLHIGDQALLPTSITPSGESSSHHKNFRVAFDASIAGPIQIVVHDVAGVAERRLSFSP